MGSAQVLILYGAKEMREPVARRHLEALEKDGALERRGRVWVLKERSLSFPSP